MLFQSFGELAHLCANYMREHGSTEVAVADVLPLAVADRAVNAAEHQRIAVGVYEALRRMERKGLVSRAGEGWKAARWRLAA
jgi:predicted nucleic acid-binding Zn ribbon protein